MATTEDKAKLNRQLQAYGITAKNNGKPETADMILRLKNRKRYF